MVYHNSLDTIFWIQMLACILYVNFCKTFSHTVHVWCRETWSQIPYNTCYAMLWYAIM